MAANGALGPEILVRCDIGADDPVDVIGEVTDFIWRLTDDGSFRFDEMPPVAIMSERVAIFEGEVNNGGLSQWYTNGGRSMESVEGTEAALRAMNALDHAAIVADFRHLISDREREAQIAEWRHGVDVSVTALDDRFFALDGDELHEVHRGWLAASGTLESVGDDEFWSRIGAMKARPEAVERRDIIAASRRLSDPANEHVRIAATLCAAVGAKLNFIEQLRHTTGWIFDVHTGGTVFGMLLLPEEGLLYEASLRGTGGTPLPDPVARLVLVDRKPQS